MLCIRYMCEYFVCVSRIRCLFRMSVVSGLCLCVIFNTRNPVGTIFLCFLSFPVPRGLYIAARTREREVEATWMSAVLLSTTILYIRCLQLSAYVYVCVVTYLSTNTSCNIYLYGGVSTVALTAKLPRTRGRPCPHTKEHLQHNSSDQSGIT